MFTGIIEEIGSLGSVKSDGHSSQLKIKAKKVLEETKLGDSICTNGVCLTVTALHGDAFEADVMNETLKSSNLGKLSPGSKVNLERAMKLSDRLGGHMVSGHVDGTGTITSMQKFHNATIITIKPERAKLKYVIEKGSIAIDGISLTVARVEESSFGISIIPHTEGETTLLNKKVGESVNLEWDLIGKYVERFLLFPGQQSEESNPTPIDENFLRENGFY